MSDQPSFYDQPEDLEIRESHIPGEYCIYCVDCWLHISKDRAKKLIGDLIEILPRMIP